MRAQRFFSLTVLTALVALLGAQAQAGYLLQPKIDNRVTSQVTVEMEVGGSLLDQGEKDTQTLPVSIVAKLVYQERPVHWSPDPKQSVRSVRRYREANATIKIGEQSLQPVLAEAPQELVAEIRDGYATVNSPEHPLTREQQDLVNYMGNSLALDRLLPGREIATGEGWDHQLAEIAPLLGMDHVAVCEVRSVVTGESKDQVQIRLAGTVHGTIDGAPTEIDLRGAYLYHLKWNRITKFNLAIKEKRVPNEVVPGLDTVAQVKLEILPAAREDRIGDESIAAAADVSQPLRRDLAFESRAFGFRLLHDAAWYPRSEQSDVLSLRLLREGSLAAHCNISTLPPRSAGRETTLEQFEQDVRASIGKNLERVKASNQWTTSLGHTCLGVIAVGKTEDVPVEWRYYLVAAPDLPRVTLAVTVEQSLVTQFADADRQLINSLELLPREAPKTAAGTAETQSR